MTTSNFPDLQHHSISHSVSDCTDLQQDFMNVNASKLNYLQLISTEIRIIQGPHLLTWFNFIPSMDK